MDINISFLPLEENETRLINLKYRRLTEVFCALKSPENSRPGNKDTTKFRTAKKISIRLLWIKKGPAQRPALSGIPIKDS